MHLRWRLSRSDACRVWAETQRAHTHTHIVIPSGQMYSRLVVWTSPLSISLLILLPPILPISSFLFPHTQPHYGGSFIFDHDPCPICPLTLTHTHTQTHRHTLWWSLVGQLEAAVFIVERMYRVVGSNHWLPFYPLGVCIPFWLSGPC